MLISIFLISLIILMAVSAVNYYRKEARCNQAYAYDWYKRATVAFDHRDAYIQIAKQKGVELPWGEAEQIINRLQQNRGENF